MTVYEWDEQKAERNKRVHGITFEQAATALEDPQLVFLLDRIVDGEVRHQAVGTADGVVLLMVAHTIRGDDNELRVRIISARKAERWERELYDPTSGW